MKTADKKREFIRLRAERLSYSRISAQLHISKSTCTAWEQELEEEVAARQNERLQELYTEYGMAKEDRIRQLGESLKKVNEALQEADLSQVPPDRLLKLKLDYTEALRREYPAEALRVEDGGSFSLLSAYLDLLQRVQAGTASQTQARAEMAILEAVGAAQKECDSDMLCESLIASSRDSNTEE